MGPYLSLKSWRIGSSWKNDLRSQIKLPMIGTVVGPGGSFLMFEDLKIEKIALMRADMQSETMMMNHVSIFFFFLCVKMQTDNLELVQRFKSCSVS